RQDESRSHIFTAAVTEEDTQSRLLQNFVDLTFRGSAMKMVMQALGNHEASAIELDEIKQLIAQIEKDQSK
ncbi:MAG: BlaI/MecI/CopY family transcriptional regulator, partial [Saprospiraceae bacterium]